MRRVRDWQPDLFDPAENNMQLFMWQRDTVTVWGGHATMMRVCFMCLLPLMMLLVMHQAHIHQPWRLDRCNPSITFILTVNQSTQ